MEQLEGLQTGRTVWSENFNYVTWKVHRALGDIYMYTVCSVQDVQYLNGQLVMCKLLQAKET